MQEKQLTTNNVLQANNEQIFAKRKSAVNRQWSNVKCSPRGFSLLELLIVIAIIALLGGVGSTYYRGFVKSIELQSISKTLGEDLRYARSKAMIGEGGVKWGVHVVNVSGGSQYYELFSTPTNYAGGTVISTTTLSTGLTFSDPSSGTNKDIIFSKISGNPVASTTVVIESEGKYSTTTISSIGTVY